jgi:hypothetical protein
MREWMTAKTQTTFRRTVEARGGLEIDSRFFFGPSPNVQRMTLHTTL